mmetsp:Transcript_6624/g.11153  ORF Transcript_6624/g.11153 Transcript_6624/m.11153 type:complete len:95 (+) Transcript_6624:164-448(+)
MDAENDLKIVMEVGDAKLIHYSPLRATENPNDSHFDAKNLSQVMASAVVDKNFEFGVRRGDEQLRIQVLVRDPNSQALVEIGQFNYSLSNDLSD